MTDPESLTSIVNERRRNVDVQTTNFSVRELVRMVAEGELNVSPEYQRLFRWDVQSESRLIESLMLGLPVPSIFVATNDDFTLEVVDGLQRLSTLVHFVSPSPERLTALSKDGPLVLDELETIPQLNGKSFRDLPKELQLHFSRTTLQVTALTDKSDYDVRFELFDRLNAGSLRLTNQEVRNAVYRGPFVAFLHDMAKLPEFKSLIQIDEARLRDGTLEETVLKFFAYRHARSDYRGPIKPFLNACMSRWRTDFPEQKFREEFESAVRLLQNVLSGSAYLRVGYHATPMVPFEAALLASARVNDDGVEAAPKDGWKEDSRLRAVSGGGHNTPGKLDERVELSYGLLRGDDPVRDQ
ncbi:DUF262 domain-containing protein [Cellulomonas sp. KH9]|uniref:DUF262 domain-containing protein n=1 Tax=Cellulomonas sp. KH9 TaxID=1855324 RepID=UPI0008E6B297|nr:DUF262 domain-containing protein [Cellulomonas sp. KH9]SFK44487.1 Protein of unknown function DUF262 [Cellulomonas sp. KH9]